MTRPYRQLGKFTVTLTVKDNHGLTGTATHRVAVLAAPGQPAPRPSQWPLVLALGAAVTTAVLFWARIRGVRLKPDGKLLRVGDVLLRTPDLEGRVRVKRHNGFISPHAFLTPEMRTALAREGFRLEQTIEISNTTELDSAIGDTLTTRHGQVAFSTELPRSGVGVQRVLLSANECGVLEWHFGPDAYLIRRHVPTPLPEVLRHLVSAAAKKVIHVFTFKLVDTVAGPVGHHLAATWEERKRPYVLRSFTPENRRKEEMTTIDAGEWRRLSAGPILLFIHGTFSRSHSAFDGLAVQVFDRLYQHYEGRVLAFDHFTLSHDPKRNVEWLLDQFPRGARLVFDIICHSRGGLVSRVLAEKLGEVGGEQSGVHVRRIIFVATPNAGTVLADSDHIGDFLDAHTNLLNWFPESDVIESMQTVLTAVKHVAVGAIDGLEGLTAMRPKGPFLKWLNAGPKGQTEYCALGSNFDCVKSAVTDRLYNGLMDRLFGVENDLVVPTGGVYDPNGSECFPIEKCRLFVPSDGISHGGFFANPAAQETLLRWVLQ